MARLVALNCFVCFRAQATTDAKGEPQAIDHPVAGKSRCRQWQHLVHRPEGSQHQGSCTVTCRVGGRDRCDRCPPQLRHSEEHTGAGSVASGALFALYISYRPCSCVFLAVWKYLRSAVIMVTPAYPSSESARKVPTWEHGIDQSCD